MDIVTGDLGPEIKYDLKFEAGALKFEITRKGGLGDEEGMYGALPASGVVDALLNSIEGLIPGDQKSMFDMVSAFIKANLPK